MKVVIMGEFFKDGKILYCVYNIMNDLLDKLF